MIRLLADEDLKFAITQGCRSREPAIDLVRAQELGLTSHRDDQVLEWAAEQRRVVVSHDTNSLIAAAWRRVARSARMPGVLAVPQRANLAQVIEDLLLVALCSDEGEWEGRVVFLPLASARG